MASIPCHSRHTNALVLPHVPTDLSNSSIQKTSIFVTEEANLAWLLKIWALSLQTGPDSNLMSVFYHLCD